jgi:hypothetical protein
VTPLANGLTAQTSTRISSDDNSSTRSIIARLPRVPSFNSSLFFRERDRATSPVSSPVLDISSFSPPVPPIPLGAEYAFSEGFTGKHCPTCQCRRHTTSTQSIESSQSPQSTRARSGIDSQGVRANQASLTLDLPRQSTTRTSAMSPPPSPFRAVFPGVLLYVPDEDERIGVRPPSSPTSSVYGGYYNESEPSSSGHRKQSLNSRR